MSVRLASLVALLGLCLALPLAAQDAGEPEAPVAEPEADPEPFPGEAPERVPPPGAVPLPPAPPPAPIVPGGAPLIHGTLQLTLEAAIKMGLENNLDVQVQRYEPLIADENTGIARGAFDPELFAEIGYLDQSTDTANVLTGVDQLQTETLDGVGGVRGIVPLLGTEYNAQFRGDRTETNQSFQALSPEFTSGWAVNVTQPLLRDLIWNEPWTQVRITRILLDASQENFRAAVMDTVSAIEDAYWALIAAEEARRVAIKSLETAQALLEQTETQYEVGVVSKVEVTEAEAGLSQRQVALIRAANQYRNQQDVLINLVLGPGLRANSTLELDPVDRPEEYTPFQVDVEAAVARAFEYRPELAAAVDEIERQDIQLRFAKNQRLPALDALLSYGENGLSGDQNPGFDPCRFSADPACDPLDPALDPTQGPWDETFGDYDDNPTWSARGRLSIPFPNRAARARVSRTHLEMRRAITQKRRLEQSIILDVRQAARNLAAGQEGIEAARAAQRAAEEQLRAERIRLEYGESTPFDVLQRERDLVDRENELIGAFQAYRTSVTALDRAQGTILRNRNIKIAEVGALR